MFLKICGWFKMSWLLCVSLICAYFESVIFSVVCSQYFIYCQNYEWKSSQCFKPYKEIELLQENMLNQACIKHYYERSESKWMVYFTFISELYI